MSYIVWHDNYTDGWSRSDDFDTLEQCFHHIATDTYGHPYVITKPVNVTFVEAEEHKTPGECGVSAGGSSPTEAS